MLKRADERLFDLISVHVRRLPAQSTYVLIVDLRFSLSNPYKSPVPVSSRGNEPLHRRGPGWLAESV